MRIKLWIIYKNGMGFSKIIAEMLQDYLEEYIDICVGNARRIDPSFLIEEGLDYLIIGDVIEEEIPSLEIQNWLLKYCEISKKRNIVMKAVSGFYVTTLNYSVQPLWIKFLENNVKAEMIYPPILHLKLNVTKLSLENGTLSLIKDYSNSFIEFIIDYDQNND